MAVSALDDLVNDLVKASGFSLSPAFLDWVADDATPMVERYVARSLGNPRFSESLGMGDPRLALARWVRHWVCPSIVVNFDELAVYLPEFADSRSAGLAVRTLPHAAITRSSKVSRQFFLPGQMASAVAAQA
jgi:hypothetical protein